MAVAAITGVLAARGKRVDLFGVLVLALVTMVGAEKSLSLHATAAVATRVPPSLSPPLPHWRAALPVPD